MSEPLVEEHSSPATPPSLVDVVAKFDGTGEPVEERGGDEIDVAQRWGAASEDASAAGGEEPWTDDGDEFFESLEDPLAVGEPEAAEQDEPADAESEWNAWFDGLTADEKETVRIIDETIDSTIASAFGVSPEQRREAELESVANWHEARLAERAQRDAEQQQQFEADQEAGQRVVGQLLKSAVAGTGSRTLTPEVVAQAVDVKRVEVADLMRQEGYSQRDIAAVAANPTIYASMVEAAADEQAHLQMVRSTVRAHLGRSAR